MARERHTTWYLEPIGDAVTANEIIGKRLLVQAGTWETSDLFDEDDVRHEVWECPYRITEAVRKNPDLRKLFTVWKRENNGKLLPDPNLPTLKSDAAMKRKIERGSRLLARARATSS